MYCILVAGMPASGKSTIAGILSKSMNIPVLSKDSIKEVLFDDLGFHSRAEKVQLGVAAMHILYYAAAQLMKAEKPFILENNFEDSSVQGIMELLEAHHYTSVTVRLTGDPAVIYQRFAARDLSDTRHRGHVVNDCYPEPPGAVRENPTRKTYEQFLDDIETRGYTRFHANGPVVEVDVTDLQALDPAHLIDSLMALL
ncbi:MAG: AAA family ATPase [Eubacteriales bacterium]|nr:AAA family ATPase [Eubacteriales bacterium]